MGHKLGFEPYTHTVGVAPLHHVADTLYTFDLGDYADVEVVGEERLVVTAVVAHERVDLQEAGLAFLDADTYPSNLGGEQT